MRIFLKKNLVAKNSCEKEHSNCQSKYFSKLSESKDASKSHAKCNIAHVSGSNVESHQRVVIKKVIQEKKACIVKDEAYIAYGFYHTKEETLNPYPSGHFLFYKIVFDNLNLASGHLKKRVKSQHSAHQNNSNALI